MSQPLLLLAPLLVSRGAMALLNWRGRREDDGLVEGACVLLPIAAPSLLLGLQHSPAAAAAPAVLL